MLENQTALIASALKTCFDRVLDLFDWVNIAEHKNELLCFTGIDSYKLSEPSDDGKRTAEAKYLIKVLGKKNMPAAELCGLFDDKAIPAVESCGAYIKEIKRLSCVYSKEQGAYIVSAEITVATPEEPSEEPPEIPKSIGFYIGNVPFSCMSSFEISRVAKTSETATVGGGIRTRLVGVRALKITVKGEIEASYAAATYSSLALMLGATGLNITVNGMSFGSMAMTGLDVVGSADEAAKVVAEFTEVNEF